MEPQTEQPKIDITVAHQARVWDYMLGGKDNYEVDRQAGEAMKEAAPGLVAMARASRTFLRRTAEHLVSEAGIRQFLDIGTGLPTADNTHRVAQAVAPECRIVYVDNDPMVLAHARALLTSGPDGATDYIDADARDTERILQQAAHILDFDQPIGLVLLGILGAIQPYDEARAIAQQYVNALPPGSHLIAGDGTSTSPEIVKAQEIRNASVRPPYIFRSPEQILGYFDGLEPIYPGVVSFTEWPEPASVRVDGYGGVGRKP